MHACEVFDLSLESHSCQGEESSFNALFEAKVITLEAATARLQSDFVALQTQLDELEVGRNRLVGEVVNGIQDVIANRVGTVEATVASLEGIAEKHDLQIHKVLNKNEHLLQMLESLVVTSRPSCAQKEKKSKGK